MASAGLTKAKAGKHKGDMVRKSTGKPPVTGGIQKKEGGGIQKMSTMSTGQYVKARAQADIAKVKAAYNSPQVKKVRSSAVGFGKQVAKASNRTFQAGKQARALYERLK